LKHSQFCIAESQARKHQTEVGTLKPATTAKPENKRRRNIIIAVVLAVLVVGALGYGAYQATKPPPSTPMPRSTPGYTLVDESPFIEYGSYWHYSAAFHQGAGIYFTIRVKEGGPIDVLLMDSGEFLDFQKFMEGKEGSFYNFKTGSALNVKAINFTFRIDRSDRYFIVLNNAGRIEGGADPTGDVIVYIRVTVPFG